MIPAIAAMRGQFIIMMELLLIRTRVLEDRRNKSHECARTNMLFRGAITSSFYSPRTSIFNAPMQAFTAG